MPPPSRNDEQGSDELLLLVLRKNSAVEVLPVVVVPRRCDAPPDSDLRFGIHVPHEADLELLQRPAEVGAKHLMHGENLVEKLLRQ